MLCWVTSSIFCCANHKQIYGFRFLIQLSFSVPFNWIVSSNSLLLSSNKKYINKYNLPLQWAKTHWEASVIILISSCLANLIPRSFCWLCGYTLPCRKSIHKVRSLKVGSCTNMSTKKFCPLYRFLPSHSFKFYQFCISQII